MATTYETRDVLAGAYRGKPESLRSHTVKVVDDRAVGVLCSTRVKVENLADSFAGDVGKAPTCCRCQHKDPRFQG